MLTNISIWQHFVPLLKNLVFCLPMYGEKKLTHPLPNLAGTRKHFKQVTFSNFASLADPLCFIKVPSIHTQARHFFGTLIHHLPALLAFLIKLLVFALTTCLSLLACGHHSIFLFQINWHFYEKNLFNSERVACWAWATTLLQSFSWNLSYNTWAIMSSEDLLI